MNPMREKFEQIYARDEWGNGSGEGSAPLHTGEYVRFLQDFLARHRVRRVVDLGCGDWQFSRLIDWTGVEYDGFDLVQSVIERNRREFAAPNRRFHLFSGHFPDLPAADLLLVKDVLQHWSNDAVTAFLPTLRRYPLALVTNCVNPRGRTRNADIASGGFRCLDLREPPFGLPAEEVLEFHRARTAWSWLPLVRRWRKSVLLFRGEG